MITPLFTEWLHRLTEICRYTYYDEKAKFEIIDFIYYIQLSSDGGVCMLVYDAPLEAYEEFIYDYYEVVSSVEIDDSKLSMASPKTDNGSNTLEKSAPSTDVAVTDYIANKNTKKFHYPNCSSVSKMSEKNKLYFQGTRDELISQGYDPCQRCKP